MQLWNGRCSCGTGDGAVAMSGKTLGQLANNLDRRTAGSGRCSAAGNPLWAHSGMSHSDSFAAEGESVLIRYFASAQIGEGLLR